jgi:hypothetical protein
MPGEAPPDRCADPPSRMRGTGEARPQLVSFRAAIQSSAVAVTAALFLAFESANGLLDK